LYILPSFGACYPSGPRPQGYTGLHPHGRCRGLAHLREELARVEALGGEGLMLRQPGSAYETGRSFTLLKIKSFHDAEAVVLAHQSGKGRHKGRLGALAVRLPDGTEFSVGTGFSDAERAAPPPLGSTITFRYQELSDGGVPRFPSFVRVCQAAGVEPLPQQGTAKTSDHAVDAAGGVRHFEFVEGKSSKFWEISRDGCEVTVRYGRIGSPGTTNVKTLADSAAAQRHAEKLTAEKMEKGYVARGA
jgi:DNA ligase 1